MEPVSGIALTVAVVAGIFAVIANIRFSSRCHTKHLNIEVEKKFKDDLARYTTSDDETSL